MSSSLAGPAHVLQLCCGTLARAALPAAERTQSIKASGLSLAGRLTNDLFLNVIVCLAASWCTCCRAGGRTIVNTSSAAIPSQLFPGLTCAQMLSEATLAKL